LELLRKYQDKNVKGEDGYLTDWLGIRHNVADLPFISGRAGERIYELPVPDDTFHAETIEYVSLLTSIEDGSDDCYTMAELGAGWGPWLVAAGVVTQRKGIQRINLIGIEGEANKIPLIQRHIIQNGLEDTSSKSVINLSIKHGVVNDGSAVKFPVVSLDAYGASLIDINRLGGQKVTDFSTVPGYSMADIMSPYDCLDFVHIDIQGYEQVLIETQIDDFQEKVRYMGIGTHSRQIECFLFDFLSIHGFILLREMPCCFINYHKLSHDNMINLTSQDGFQLWMNRGLCPKVPGFLRKC
jgi:hypothetical protein